MTALLWLRRDLRLHHHPALRAALAQDDRVVPVFCFDQRILAGRHASGARTQFMLECLADLDRTLRERGSRLVLRHGYPEHELAALATALDARTLHVSADVGPFARWRDARVGCALVRAGVEVHSHPDTFVTDDLAAIRSGSGGPYQVFTPFHRAWLRQSRREVLAAPRSLPALPSTLDGGALPSLSDLGLRQELSDPVLGGERAARESMGAFLAATLADYSGGRDPLGRPSTSRLSPYVHFGCISPRELEDRLGDGAGAADFRRQLCWRDFYAQVLLNFPRNARSEHQARHRGAIRWSRAQTRFAAWRDGRTGFRWSTRECVSSSARGGCTTAPA